MYNIQRLICLLFRKGNFRHILIFCPHDIIFTIGVKPCYFLIPADIYCHCTYTLNRRYTSIEQHPVNGRKLTWKFHASLSTDFVIKLFIATCIDSLIQVHTFLYIGSKSTGSNFNRSSHLQIDVYIMYLARMFTVFMSETQLYQVRSSNIQKVDLPKHFITITFCNYANQFINY